MSQNKTDIVNGLSESEVAHRIENGLVNGDFNVPSKSIKQIFKDNCLTFFNFINIILAIFVVAVGSFKNCLFLGVILCNTAIGIFQEIRSKKAVDKLALISAPKAKVIRNGKEEIIAVKDIVMDDLMILGAGNQICSDCIVLQGECEVNESLITGESDPVTKKEGDEILSGSFVICGDVKAQVIRIGADNYANKITSGAKYIKKNKSEMLESINYVLKIISICIIPMIILMFSKELLFSKSSLPDAIISTVSSIIGMIPEGLYLLTSIAMAASAIKLAKQRVLVQDMNCIETLARVDVLCVDKTGTITEPRMEVENVIPLTDDP
ncbi:MAG: HAD-IC family P-type ATPase, partial [Ruminiclostridium sp.]|nr:HAD-IC family P-type ATPase [Ruminiclostridium sp.]